MKKFVYLITVLGVVFLSIPAYAQQEDHLVALYFFDDEDGDEVIDSSGNENHGVFRGNIKRVDGIFEGGLEFNGQDTFVEIQDSDSLDLVEGLTIAMWIYLRNYSTAGGTGVTKETAYKVGSRDNMRIEVRGTTVGGAWSPNEVFGDTELPLEEWHHIAGTYDAASGDVVTYLDGEEDGSGNFSGELVPNDSVVWIGRGNAPYFDGVYDEVAVWNVALSQAEIAQVMNTLHTVEPSGKLAATWGRVKIAY